MLGDVVAFVLTNRSLPFGMGGAAGQCLSREESWSIPCLDYGTTIVLVLVLNSIIISSFRSLRFIRHEEQDTEYGPTKRNINKSFLYLWKLHI